MFSISAVLDTQNIYLISEIGALSILLAKAKLESNLSAIHTNTLWNSSAEQNRSRSGKCQSMLISIWVVSVSFLLHEKKIASPCGLQTPAITLEVEYAIVHANFHTGSFSILSAP